MSGRFEIRTYGCQMNVHDTQKLANLLVHAGFEQAAPDQAPELLLINTCSIREKAEHRLYSELGALRPWKRERPGRVLGVGGCVAQQEGDALLRRFPDLDFVFGTHNLRLVPAMARAALDGVRSAHTEESRSQERFDLPVLHERFTAGTPGRAFLTVMEGCDMFCSFCIVPRTRGREISRPAREIVREAQRLAERGVREFTLLGQTVNAYGRRDARRAAVAARAGGDVDDSAGDAGRSGHSGDDGRNGERPFAALLAELARIPGVTRLRYTSPHPVFFDEALVRAHGELPELCPHVHLPLQSGSDAVLQRMRRRYTAREYLKIVQRLRAARPDIAITSDLIVGFPGETRAQFEETLAVMREAAFVDSYAFKYSSRPGTAAAQMTEEAVDPQEAQARLEDLQTLQRELTLAAHRARVGGRCEVLVEGASARGARRGGAAGGQQHAGGPQLPQQMGRDPWHRVVNFTGFATPPQPGELVEVELVEATPHSLIGVAIGKGAAEGDDFAELGPARDASGRELLPLVG